MARKSGRQFLRQSAFPLWTPIVCKQKMATSETERWEAADDAQLIIIG